MPVRSQLSVQSLSPDGSAAEISYPEYEDLGSELAVTLVIDTDVECHLVWDSSDTAGIKVPATTDSAPFVSDSYYLAGAPTHVYAASAASVTVTVLEVDR